MSGGGLILARLETAGRSLTVREAASLDWAIRRQMRKGQRPWLPKDELALIRAVRKRRRIADIAASLGRTERAVWRRVTLLRKQGRCGYLSPVGGTGRYERKSSKALDGAEE